MVVMLITDRRFPISSRVVQDDSHGLPDVSSMAVNCSAASEIQQSDICGFDRGSDVAKLSRSNVDIDTSVRKLSPAYSRTAQANAVVSMSSYTLALLKQLAS